MPTLKVVGGEDVVFARRRPSKFTPEAAGTIIRLVRSGVPNLHAARSAGVAESVLYDWLNKGREARSGKYREFADAFDAAHSNFVTLMQQTVTKAALADTSHWRAALALLERRDPAHYSPKRIIEHVGSSSESPVQVMFANSPDGRQRAPSEMHPDEIRAELDRAREHLADLEEALTAKADPEPKHDTPDRARQQEPRLLGGYHDGEGEGS